MRWTIVALLDNIGLRALYETAPDEVIKGTTRVVAATMRWTIVALLDNIGLRALYETAPDEVIKGT
ncbi:hypothetical protein, partial [Aquitalea magnusonii]|uniref:hypothetical protein n=1 Tax=Aquitalea magnusonii TaxID=332411 RepID=UPI00128F89A0